MAKRNYLKYLDIYTQNDGKKDYKHIKPLIQSNSLTVSSLKSMSNNVKQLEHNDKTNRRYAKKIMPK